MNSSAKIHPTFPGTVIMLLACGLGYFISLQDMLPSKLAQWVSVSLLIGMLISFVSDMRHGLKNLLRVDVFAFLSFYFLTFFEFLFPQGRFDSMSNPADVAVAIQLFLVGWAAMTIGRHLDVFPKNTLSHIGDIQMRTGDYLLIFFGAAFLNFLPMFLAVEFNPVAWFEETLKPRFGRAWGRGRYGDLSALLHELQLLGYVLPPVAGVIFARWRSYSKFALVMVALTILLLWYSSFSGGTRNIFAIQIAGLLAGYYVVQRQIKLKFLVPIVIFSVGSFVILAQMMLEFRNIGLGKYVSEGYYTSDYREFRREYLAEKEQESGYFVDYNLYSFSQIGGVFPDLYDYIGWNLVYVALTKPIPRAFWPGKPTDLKTGIEEALGADGSYTIAVTWVGEAYMAGGVLWIIAVGLFIGGFCCYWNTLAHYAQNTYPLIVFASGFYAVLLLMRSLQFFTTSILPSIALIVMGIVIHNSRAREYLE